MRLFAINGSPRKNGNTSALLNKFIEGAAREGAEAGRVDIIDISIRPVDERDYFPEDTDLQYATDDDMKILISGLKNADIVVMASPIFFGSITGQMKTMIDRFQFAWIEKNLRKRDLFPGVKKGAFISVQAQFRSDFFDNAAGIIKHFFSTVNVNYSYELLCTGLEGRSDAAENPAYLERAFDMGRDIVLASRPAA